MLIFNPLLSITMSNSVTSGTLILFALTISCFIVPRRAAYLLDKQYRDPAGTTRSTYIPHKYHVLFHVYEYPTLRISIVIQIMGYICTLVVTGLFIATLLLDHPIQIVALVWLVTGICHFATLFCCVLPFSIMYHYNTCHKYDMDIITILQRILTLYPERKCKIIEIISDEICVIRIGLLGCHKYRARNSKPVKVGAKLRAVHKFDNGFPYWQITKY